MALHNGRRRRFSHLTTQFFSGTGLVKRRSDCGSMQKGRSRPEISANDPRRGAYFCSDCFDKGKTSWLAMVIQGGGHVTAANPRSQDGSKPFFFGRKSKSSGFPMFIEPEHLEWDNSCSAWPGRHPLIVASLLLFSLTPSHCHTVTALFSVAADAELRTRTLLLLLLSLVHWRCSSRNLLLAKSWRELLRFKNSSPIKRSGFQVP